MSVLNKDEVILIISLAPGVIRMKYSAHFHEGDACFSNMQRARERERERESMKKDYEGVIESDWRWG